MNRTISTSGKAFSIGRKEIRGASLVKTLCFQCTRPKSHAVAEDPTCPETCNSQINIKNKNKTKKMGEYRLWWRFGAEVLLATQVRATWLRLCSWKLYWTLEWPGDLLPPPQGAGFLWSPCPSSLNLYCHLLSTPIAPKELCLGLIGDEVWETMPWVQR